MQGPRPVLDGRDRKSVGDRSGPVGGGRCAGDRHDVALSDRHGAYFAEHGAAGRAADFRCDERRDFGGGHQACGGGDVPGRIAGRADQAQADQARFRVDRCDEQMRFGLVFRRRELRVGAGDQRHDHHAQDDQFAPLPDYLDVVAESLRAGPAAPAIGRSAGSLGRSTALAWQRSAAHPQNGSAYASGVREVWTSDRVTGRGRAPAWTRAGHLSDVGERLVTGGGRESMQASHP